MGLSNEEVLKQSEGAMATWKNTWDKHAKINGALYKKINKKHKDLLYKGIGKTLLCIASGPSLEKHIDELKNLSPAVEIACVDKAMSDLIKNGIIPKYVILADAGIDYKQCCEPYIEHAKDMILLSNILGNPEWAQNWHDKGGEVFFYLNKDNIHTEERYAPMSGCKEVIPASSNVSNALLVFATQILGFDKYLLLGYDYCWGDNEKYYAFNDGIKRYWMKHLQMLDMNGRMVDTSQNLLFSARWLTDFHNNFLRQKNIKVLNCSGQGILQIPNGNLKKQLKNAKIRTLNDADRKFIYQAFVEKAVVTTPDVQADPNALNNTIEGLNVSEVHVFHLPKEVLHYLQ